MRAMAPSRSSWTRRCRVVICTESAMWWMKNTSTATIIATIPNTAGRNQNDSRVRSRKERLLLT